VNVSHVIEELVEERGLDKETLTGVVCEGIKAAYEKKYPTLVFSVEQDSKTGEVTIQAKMKVVSQVENDLEEISLRKARAIKKSAEIGDEIEVPFEGQIGRIEILKAKQIIAQRIRDIEASLIYEQFKDKVDTIVHGPVHKTERAGVVIKLGDALGFLPRSLMIPQETCPVGHTVKALLKEVLEEPRHENQLILDRASAEFVAKLFELEIPEVFEKIVEIKKIVRSPGYKTKVVVDSREENIDPVGTCIGVGGARIKPILRELGSEKIDVIRDTHSREELIRNSLKPAVVNRVEIIDDENAHVWVDEDQRSLAIGKNGQNIALASKLTGLTLTIIKPEESEEAEVEEFQELET